jgi:hypothetical protein
VGNEKRSVDLINCQEGRGDIPIFQVGKGEEMSSAEDQRSILIIGGIEIFLPRSQGEASICVVDAATKGQQVETVMEEEEKILEV